jgi:hypothetical protein
MSALAAKLVKDTNPEKVSFNAPLFLFELREFPRLLRDMGGFLSRKIDKIHIKDFGAEAAAMNVALEFGWKPLISDLGKMLSCMRAIEARKKLLASFTKTGGRTFTRDLYSDYTESSGLVTANSWPVGLTCMESRKTSTKIWGYASWRLVNPLPDSDQELMDLAFNLYNGLNFRPSQLWEAMPWSWFVDYFLNVGDLVAATEGRFYFDLDQVRLMQQTTTEVAATKWPDSRPWLSMTPYSGTYVTKDRFTPTLGVDTNTELPILDARQTSILGSLYLTKKTKLGSYGG